MQPHQPAESHRGRNRRLVVIGVAITAGVMLALLLLARCWTEQAPSGSIHPAATDTTPATQQTTTPQAHATPPVQQATTPAQQATTPAQQTTPTPRTRPHQSSTSTGTPPEEVPTASTTLDIYRARCREAAGQLALARVIYDPNLTMRTDETSTVSAVVTFNKSAAPSVVLPGHSDATAQPVGVTCQVQARLRGATSDFDVEPGDWESRALFDNGSARWDWSVLPKRAGHKELILDLRPVVRLENQQELNVTGTEFVTEPFRSEVVVTDPAGRWIASWVDRGGRFLQSVVVVLTALAAIFGFLGGRTWWRGRKGRADLTIADPAQIFEELHKVRVAREVDADEVAQRLGISRNALRAMEAGARVPTVRNLYDYAAALDIDLVLRPKTANRDR